MKVSSVEEMRSLDKRAIEECHIPGHVLMENAGHAAVDMICREWGNKAGHVVVVCGMGHNGGDGLVVARKLLSRGIKVRTLLLADPSALDETVKLHLDAARGCGVDLVVQPDLEQIAEAFADCDAIVDALLGTGISREVKGLYREVIERINGASKPVFSLDIPSGVDGNNGQICGVAVKAQATVTFGLPKRGNLLYPGAELGGRLYLDHISFPPELQRSEDIKVSLNIPPMLPRRKVDGHKGSFADVLFVAGSGSYLGAPALAALSLLKAGGGYARLAAPRSIVPVLATIGSEIVFVPQQETASQSLSLGNAVGLLELSRKVDLVVVGPGLSLVDETQELVLHLAAEIDRPLLIDGDGLTAIAEGMEVMRSRRHPTILTPHLGEMSRISGLTVGELETDLIGAVQQTAAEFNAILVLKGAHSLIGLPDGQVLINLSGNSGMATAGSGDVLTGTIAAMTGLGLSIERAVSAGVFIHGLAGDLAARALGEDGITARDVLDHLPLAVKAFREDPDLATRDFYGFMRVI